MHSKQTAFQKFYSRVDQKTCTKFSFHETKFSSRPLFSFGGNSIGSYKFDGMILTHLNFTIMDLKSTICASKLK